MKTKFILIFLFAISALINWGCSKSATNGPDKNEPLLFVADRDIRLTGNPYVDRIEIINNGGGSLQWDIEEKPEWINISSMAGTITSDTATIRISASFDSLEYGTYQGIIKINSNGGALTIQVEFENKPPQLKIENLVVNMDRHYSSAELVIMNQGGGELVWNITQAPDWVEFQITGDSVRSFAQHVPFRVKFRSLDYGYYESKIVIESNGGSAEIAIFFTYEREIEVYPGIGAAYVELGQTYTMVQSQWGTPDKNWYDRPEHTLFIHPFTYDDIGLHFAVKTNSLILFGSGKVGYIELFPPYDGMTEKLIGIGSTVDELTAAYGQPTSKAGKEWFYEEGITFIIKNNKINGIIIKEEDF